MEQLDDKYNFDYYPTSESDYESELEHKCETLTQNDSIFSLLSIKEFVLK